MSKRLIITIGLVLVVAMTLLPMGCYAQKSKVTYFNLRVKPAMNSVTLKWKKQKGVSFYRISRIDITKDRDREGFDPVRSNYKAIAKVSGKKKAFRDNRVKTRHCYAYLVDGYKKKGGKTRLVCSTYQKGSYYEEWAGLSRPYLTNGGYGEFDTNSPVCLYLWLDVTGGVCPRGVELYRKANDEKAFRKIKSIRLNPDTGTASVKDDSVAPGKTYTYKIRSFVKKGGRKYRSAWSNRITLPAVNFTGTYKVKTLTPEGKQDHCIIRLTSHKYNGRTVFHPGTTNGYDYQLKGREEVTEIVALAAWSRDGKAWVNKAPAAGVPLEAGGTIWLKYRITREKGGGTTYFAGDGSAPGSKVQESVLRQVDDNVDYFGPGIGFADMRLDLVKGEGTVFQNFD